MDDPKRVRRLVKKLVDALNVPVTAKIRIFPNVADTVAFALRLQDAGVAAIAVHGRRREQRHHEGIASWEAIAAVKAALSIPVIANGNILTPSDIDACLQAIGADAVMSATSLLWNPRLFRRGDMLHQTREGRFALAFEYLQFCRRWPDGALPRMISDHLLTILREELESPEVLHINKLFKAYRTFVEPGQ